MDRGEPGVSTLSRETPARVQRLEPQRFPAALLPDRVVIGVEQEGVVAFIDCQAVLRIASAHAAVSFAALKRNSPVSALTALGRNEGPYSFRTYSFMS